MGSLDRLSDVLATGVIEILPIFYLQELAIPRDGPERFLKVMRGRVGDFFQVFVASPQFRRLLLQEGGMLFQHGEGISPIVGDPSEARPESTEQGRVHQ